MIKRIYDDLKKLLRPGKIIVLYGPRQAGKTTLVKNFLKQTSFKYQFTTGDDLETREVFQSQNLKQISEFVQNYELIIIDEAQRIPDVGWGLKLLIDAHPNLRVLITGSASLDLSYKVGEPLVGRMLTYTLFPVSTFELSNLKNTYSLKKSLNQQMIYGSYPEILEAKKSMEKKQLLRELVNTQLLKDVFELENLKKPHLLLNLLKLLAFQVGSEVSLTELGKTLEVDKKTVSRYIWLLEQTFILYRLSGYSRNLRKEITKMDKFYFADNGVRNAIINNFNDFQTRDDVGALWENFLISERLKKQAYKPIYANNYFWRTWDQREVDWVEEREGKLFGYEFKWNRSRSEKSKQVWMQTYSEANFEVITEKNYLKFIGRQ